MKIKRVMQIVIASSLCAAMVMAECPAMVSASQTSDEEIDIEIFSEEPILEESNQDWEFNETSGEGWEFIEASGEGWEFNEETGEMTVSSNDFMCPDEYKEKVKSVVICDGVTKIEAEAFYNCTNMETVSIPETVTIISTAAFAKCYSLHSIVIPSHVEYLGDFLFDGSIGLEKIENKSQTSCPVPTMVNAEWYDINDTEKETRIYTITNGTMVAAYLNEFDEETGTYFVHSNNSSLSYEVSEKLKVLEIDERVTSLPTFHSFTTESACANWEKVINHSQASFQLSVYVDGKDWYSEDDLEMTKPLESIENGTAVLKDSWNYDKEANTLNVYHSSFSFRRGIDDATEIINIGDDVTTIGLYNYDMCSDVKELNIGKNLVEMPDGFLTGSSLEKITVSKDNAKFEDEDCNAIIEKETKQLLLASVNTIIPDDVKSIGNNAFCACKNLKSITIPAGVEYLEPHAFYFCTELEEIIVAEGNEHYDSRDNCNAIITMYAGCPTIIRGCKGTRIPDTVVIIDTEAFANCTGLTSIVIPSSVNGLEFNVFGNCENLTRIENNSDYEIQMPEPPLGYDGVYYWYNESDENRTPITSIANGIAVRINDGWEFDEETGTLTVTKGEVRPKTIDYLAVKKLVIGDGVKKIADSAFSNGLYSGTEFANLETVSFAEGLEEIGYDAFTCTGITELNLPSSLRKIGEQAFANINITALEIPEGVTEIGQRAFSNNDSLESVVIPSTISEIPSHAFAFDSNLSNITIKNGVSKIGDNAFNSSAITSITIPESVTAIDSSAFTLNSNLKKIKNDSSAPYEFEVAGTNYKWYNITDTAKKNPITSIANGTAVREDYVGDDFKPEDPDPKPIVPKEKAEVKVDESGTAKITGEGVIEIPQEIKETVKKIEISEGVTSITADAFARCKQLTEVTLPETVETIEAGAFEDCEQLKEVKIPESVITIGAGAFKGCKTIEEIEIPKSVTVIGEGAFKQCSSLKEVSVPVTAAIGAGAFAYCPNVKKLTLTSSDDLNAGMLGDYLGGNAATIGENAFYGCDNLTEIRGGKNIKSVGKNAFYATKSVDTTVDYEASIALRKYNWKDSNRNVTYKDFEYLNATNPASVFKDIKKNAWYAKAGGPVSYAVDHGIMNGISNDKFDPEGSCTRAMFVQILYNLEGRPGAGSKNPFEDVPDKWFKDAVTWAVEQNITKGTTSTTFAPDMEVSRETVAQFLMRYAQYRDYDITARADISKYPDSNKVSGWAKEAVSWANANGIINGYGDGRLAAGDKCTRAQIAQMIMNFQAKFGK